MIRHTVLMPFARLRFAPILREYMRGQKVEWRPLHDDHVLVPDGDKGEEKREERKIELLSIAQDEEDASWIKPWRCDKPAEYNVGHWVCDRFLDAMFESDKAFYSSDHYVSFMCDDCLWNWGYWAKLRSYFDSGNVTNPDRGWQAAQSLARPQGPKIIVSGFKNGGMEQPPTYFPPNIDWKQPESWGKWQRNSCRTFATMFEVLTVRADLLRDVRFGPLWCADGMVMERLVEEHGMTPAFACMVYKEALHPHKYGFPSTHQR